MISTLYLSIVVTISAYDSPSIGNQQLFPSDNPWHWDISTYEIHPNSANFINSIGKAGSLHPDFGTVWNNEPNGIPYVVVSASTPMVNVTFTDYGDESDVGPYRIPLNAPIEGGSNSDGDRHVIAVDTSNDLLYELYRAFPKVNYWNASSGAIFNLAINDHHPITFTSADAAGLPIFPGLVRYEEVVLKKEINHALRMTVTQSQKAFIFPARHHAGSSTDINRPPMGLRLRLKSGYDISSFSSPVQVILKALKKYGLIIADNGSNYYLSGAPDSRWNDDSLSELQRVKGNDLEVVRTVDSLGNPVYPVASIRHSSRIPVVKSFATSVHQFDIRGKFLTGRNMCNSGIVVTKTAGTNRIAVKLQGISVP